MSTIIYRYGTGKTGEILIQNWAYCKYMTIDYNFDIGESEELTIVECLKELKR